MVGLRPGLSHFALAGLKQSEPGTQRNFLTSTRFNLAMRRLIAPLLAVSLLCAGLGVLFYGFMDSVHPYISLHLVLPPGMRDEVKRDAYLVRIKRGFIHDSIGWLAGGLGLIT